MKATFKQLIVSLLLCFCLSSLASKLPSTDPCAFGTVGANEDSPRHLSPFELGEHLTRLFPQGSYERQTFRYATSWPFEESARLLRQIPKGLELENLDPKVAFTLAATIVHSWKNAEKYFSLDLIHWATNQYSILDMPWVNLRNRFNPPISSSERRIHLHFPSIQKNYEHLAKTANRSLFRNRYKNFEMKRTDLEQVLRSTWRVGAPLESEMKDFKVETHTLESDGSLFEEGWIMKWRNTHFQKNGFTGIYNLGLDAPFGMVLKYQEEPIGVVSFDLVGNALFVNHIQGAAAKLFRRNPQGGFDYIRDKKGDFVRAPSHSAIGRIDFRRTLVKLAEVVAREHGLHNLIIQGGQNNKWLLPHGEERPDLTLDKATSIYDGTAKRMGGTPDMQGNWVIPVPRKFSPTDVDKQNLKLERWQNYLALHWSSPEWKRLSVRNETGKKFEDSIGSVPDHYLRQLSRAILGDFHAWFEKRDSRTYLENLREQHRSLTGNYPAGEHYGTNASGVLRGESNLIDWSPKFVFKMSFLGQMAPSWPGPELHKLKKIASSSNLERSKIFADVNVGLSTLPGFKRTIRLHLEGKNFNGSYSEEPLLTFKPPLPREMNALIERMGELMSDIRELNPDDPNSRAKLLPLLSDYVQLFAIAHPFERANFSLAMGQANYILSRHGLRGISHGDLDFAAMVNARYPFQKIFKSKVEQANPR